MPHQTWTIPVNWENAVTEEVAYRTEIITSRDGTEQRIAQRVNPRYLFRFSTLVGRDRAAELERLLSKRQASNYRFQHPRETILSDRGHPGAAGFTGRFDREAMVTAVTDRVLSVDVSVQVNPGVYPGDYLIGYSHPAADTLHNGLEVLTLRPNWADPVRLNFMQMSEILDLQKGVRDFNTPEVFTNRLVQCGFMLRDEAQENLMRGLFERMRGQQGEFYMVDPLSAQIVPSANIPLNATSITVPGPEVFQRFASEKIYRNIAIRTTSGTIYRKVSSIQLVSGDSRIAFASPLPLILLSSIIGVHWLLRVRFAADTMTLTWTTDTVARTSFTLRPLEET